jgi:hypothetical protein
MKNKIPHGQCAHYSAQSKPQPGDKPAKSLHRGHCLIGTVYAVNKPGTQNYPLNAKTAELPFGRHQIKSVRENDIDPHCPSATPRP